MSTEKRSYTSCSRPAAELITIQEKRTVLQNFAHFQQFSRPSAKGNTFAYAADLPRSEAACALCQQKDFLEHRRNPFIGLVNPSAVIKPPRPQAENAKTVVRRNPGPNA